MGAKSFLRKLMSGGRDGIDRRTDALLALCNALLAESGEYASTALARDALAAYQALDERARSMLNYSNPRDLVLIFRK